MQCAFCVYSVISDWGVNGNRSCLFAVFAGSIIIDPVMIAGGENTEQRQTT